MHYPVDNSAEHCQKCCQETWPVKGWRAASQKQKYSDYNLTFIINYASTHLFISLLLCYLH